MSAQSEAIVATLLEDDYDQHMKAYNRVQKWDGAHSTFQNLLGLKQKQLGLMHKMGQAISYERALARVGLTRQDVDKPIYGDTIGATDNFKGTRPRKVCNSHGCSQAEKYSPETDKCPRCDGPLSDVNVGYAQHQLRATYARHIFGVKTKDGRRVWFKEPVAPSNAPAA